MTSNEIVNKFNQIYSDSNNLQSAIQAEKIMEMETYNINYPVRSNFHNHEHDVKNNFIGKHADYEIAIKKAIELDQKEHDEAYKNTCKNYENLEIILSNLLYNASAKENNFSSDSKVFALIWNKTCEDGHSIGYENIIYNVNDICDLISSIKEAEKEDSKTK